jgi:hypothetical protein
MYSDFFALVSPAYYELYCPSISNPEIVKFFRVKISIQEEIHYLQVTEIERGNVTKLIKNSTHFPIEVKSTNNKQEPTQYVKAGESIHYAQCYPKASGSELKITLANSKGEFCSSTIDLMIIKTEPVTYEIGEANLLLRSTVSFVGANTVLELSTVRKDNFRSRDLRQDAFKNMLQYSISAVSVSFMRLPTNKPRQELLNLVLTNVSGFVQVRGGSEITFDGSIGDVQVDNNSSETTNFPVVLKKAFIAGEERLAPEARIFCGWHVVVENPVKSSHWYFSDVTVKFSKVEAFIEEEFVDCLINYCRRLLKTINVEASRDIKHCLKGKYYSDFLELPDDFDFSKMVWELAELVPTNNFVFLELFSVSPIEVELSYYQDAKSTVDKDFELFSLIGVIIGGFEEAQISLKMISQE